MDKRTVSTALAKHVANPLVARVAGYVPWYALLETRGRASGRPRRTPVGDGLRGDVFWIVADHGLLSNYVKNIRRDPRVRVRTHGRWRSGTATLLMHDDPIARQRALGFGANALFVRLAGTALLTVRIALEPPGTTGSSR
jgi:deazaflavin-dependent oxidoreductase (nitroreductase family)